MEKYFKNSKRHFEEPDSSLLELLVCDENEYNGLRNEILNVTNGADSNTQASSIADQKKNIMNH